MFSADVRCIVIVGAQWGDEGKGKVTDVLAEQATIVARYQGGANAGHTVQVGDDEFILHLVPSGALNPGARCLLGNGVVVDPWTLLEEMDALEARGVNIGSRLGVSRRAHLVLPYHKRLDGASEAHRGSGRIGTTGRGIGPAYRDKASRTGVRVGDLHDLAACGEVVRRGSAAANGILERLEASPPVDADEVMTALEQVAPRLLALCTDVGDEIDGALAGDGRVLLEGAQGSLLDIDHGTYPYVTSSTTTAGGAASGVGIGPTRIDEVVGVVKAYTTRVGNGPLPTELDAEQADRLRRLGDEFGATTGRPRRPGWFDGVVVRYAGRVNGLTALAVTKLDVLDTFAELRLASRYEADGVESNRFPEDAAVLARSRPVYEVLPGWQSPTGDCRTWDDLPSRARAYLDRIQEIAAVPIRYVSVGAARSQIVRILPGHIA